MGVTMDQLEAERAQLLRRLEELALVIEQAEEEITMNATRLEMVEDAITERLIDDAAE